MSATSLHCFYCLQQFSARGGMICILQKRKLRMRPHIQGTLCSPADPPLHPTLESQTFPIVQLCFRVICHKEKNEPSYGAVATRQLTSQSSYSIPNVGFWPMSNLPALATLQVSRGIRWQREEIPAPPSTSCRTIHPVTKLLLYKVSRKSEFIRPFIQLALHSFIYVVSTYKMFTHFVNINSFNPIQRVMKSK